LTNLIFTNYQFNGDSVKLVLSVLELVKANLFVTLSSVSQVLNSVKVDGSPVFDLPTNYSCQNCTLGVFRFA